VKAWSLPLRLVLGLSSTAIAACVGFFWLLIPHPTTLANSEYCSGDLNPTLRFVLLAGTFAVGSLTLVSAWDRSKSGRALTMFLSALFIACVAVATDGTRALIEVEARRGRLCDPEQL
jgi:hypothetical protein